MTNFEEYKVIVQAIIKSQELIVGPLAWSEASKVSGLRVKGQEISISGDGKKILEFLVKQYETLFGLASVEACKDAVRPLLPNIGEVDLPKNLL